MHPLEEQLARITTGSRVLLHFPSYSFAFGDPGSPLLFEAKVGNERFWDALLSKGNLALGECYMDGHFEPVAGEIYEFLVILLRAQLDLQFHRSFRIKALALRLRVLDALRSRARNVRSHYDIGDEVYRSFLDDSMTYSCGYAKSPGDSLGEMQIQKFERISDKLELTPDDLALDIGCGYGGLLMHFAERCHNRCYGVTNSLKHAEFATQKASQSGFDVSISCIDFTAIEGRFDKIVSVGMLEHVPRRAYKEYFGKIAHLLKPGGLCLLHFIGCGAAVNRHDPFIQKYIFPGSNQPRLSEVCKFLEREELFVLDIENLVTHYRLTVLHWLANFRRNQSRLLSNHYDHRFLRMWEYYLHCGIAAATISESALFQILITNDREKRSRLVRI